MDIRAVSDNFRQGDILNAARGALNLRLWIAEPDSDQEGGVQRAEAVPAWLPATLPLPAAQGFGAWIDSGEQRASIGATLISSWRPRQLLLEPIPLTGAAALRAGAPEEGCGAC
jgi:hypothetical protein